ncbi:MAG: NosD domain-containing protein [Candidatus Asgardarchaeum sp.]
MRHATIVCGVMLFILVMSPLLSITLNESYVRATMKRDKLLIKLEENNIHITAVINGDWNITSATTFENGEVTVNGRIFIKSGGTLILRNATVYMNPTYNGEFWIEVFSGGALILDNATITVYNPDYRYYIKLDKGAKFIMSNNSEISFAGFVAEPEKLGIWINTDNVTISESRISNCYEVYVYNVTNLTITDTEVCCCSEIKISKSSNITIEDNIISNLQNSLTFESSHDVEIRNNTIYDSTYSGISLSNVNDTVIEFNILNNTGNSISIGDSYNIVLRENKITRGDYGVYISSSANITISDNEIWNNGYGVYIEFAFNITVLENNITSFTSAGIEISGSNKITVKKNYVDNVLYYGCFYGIELSSGENNSILQNTVKGCSVGLFILGANNSHVSGNTLLMNPIIVFANTKNEISGLVISDDNTLNGHPIKYYYNLSGKKITGGTIGELLFLYSENITIINVAVHTLFIGYSNNISASYIFAENSTYGVYVVLSHHITIENSNVQRNKYGVFLYYSDHISIRECNVKDNSDGVYTHTIQYMYLSECTISENTYGLHANNLDDSIVSKTIFMLNSYSLKINSQSANITFYLNDFLLNDHAPIDNGANRFDNGTIGNYWMRYSGSDLNNDGIGDTPYYIDSDSVDHYPLMAPYRFEDTIAPIIHSVSRVPEQPNSSEVVIIYANVTDNIRIKTVILSYYNGSGWTNVTMTYNETIGLYVGVIPNLPQNTTVQYRIYAVDYSGNWAVSDTYSYTVTPEVQERPPEYPVELIIIVILMIAVVIIIAAYKLRKKKEEK